MTRVTAGDVARMLWEKENKAYVDAVEAMEKTPEWKALDDKLEELEVQSWDDKTLREVAPLERESLHATPEWRTYDEAYKTMQSLLDDTMQRKI